jgi:hypothetical protein
MKQRFGIQIPRERAAERILIPGRAVIFFPSMERDIFFFNSFTLSLLR